MRSLVALAMGILAILTSTMASAAQSEAPAGLITPSGVPVAVLAPGPGGYRVTTPCGHEAFVAGGRPLHQVTAVLDPGHGGPVDTGAVGANGLAEKDLNLRVATTAARLLEDQGISTVLTRTGDYATPLRVRANLADALGAAVLVSIHHNAPTQAPSSRPGIEIFHESRSDESRRLGGLLYERAMTALSMFEVRWVAPEDAGVMAVLNSRGSDAYGMIRLPDTTSVLVELGYIANPAEAEFFAKPLYPRVAANALAAGIWDFLHTEGEGSGFVDPRIFNPQPGVGRSLCQEVPLGWAPPPGSPR